MSNAFKKLREDEFAQRKNIILDSAQTLFETSELKEITMKMIGKNIGLATASIYNYFKSKEEIYLKILARDVSNIVSKAEEIMAKGGLPSDEIATLYIDYFLKKEAMFKIICHFIVINDSDAESVEDFWQIINRITEIFDPVLELNQYDKMLKDAFFNSLFGIVIANKNSPEKDNTEKREHMYQLGRIVSLSLQTLLSQSSHTQTN